jgi:hypothetical protein
MIYLIITTCINNHFGIKNAEQRKQEYVTAITESLRHLPSEIKPVIVENNGISNETYLEHFQHNNSQVPIIYTTNNHRGLTNKGMIELLDIKDVINHYAIKDNDMIIKLTGRYTVTSSLFFNTVLQHPEIDAFIKFYNVCTKQYYINDSIMGLYAVRASLLRYWSHLTINYHLSAEVAFAYHVRLHTENIYEVQQLDLDCIFAEDGVKLKV